MSKERRTTTAKGEGSAKSSGKGGKSASPSGRSAKAPASGKGAKRSRGRAERPSASGSSSRSATTAEPKGRASSAAGPASRKGSPERGSGGEAAADLVALYRELAEELTDAESLDAAVARAVDRICRFASFAVGYGVVDPASDPPLESWWTDESGDYESLRESLAAWGSSTDDGEEAPVQEVPESPLAEASPGTLIGRAISSGLPVSVDRLGPDDLEEAEIAAAAGLQAAFAFPVFFGSEIAAVLAFLRTEPGPLDHGLADAVGFAVRQLEVMAGSEKAERAVRAAARHARAQAVELNEMAVRLRAVGSHGGDGMYDALTGFPRRRLLLDRLQQALRRRQRNPDLQFAVACLGLEGLGRVRDRLGLRASEEFLLALCRRMEAALRPADTIARTGDDEFTIILEDSEGLVEANAAAERVQAAVRRSYRLDGEEVRAKASIGLALSSPHYEYAETILRDATAALRASRAFADEKPRVFDVAEQPRSMTGRPDEEELIRALNDGELALEYQPVVSLRSGRVAGFEARARWLHPDRGALAPEQFLPESAGPAVSALVSWSLRQAATQVVEWRRARPSSPPYVAVVLSSEQFYSPDLVTETWDVLTSIDLDGSLLRYVVGEGVLARSPGQASQVLASLGALDVGVVMDGFGTGYSSLPSLHRLRPRGLVIDRAFLVGASSRPSQWLVARTIVELARIIDAEAIASGIETGDQLARLYQLGCQRAQGPFFGGGLEADKTAVLLLEGFGPEVRAMHRPEGEARADSPFTRFLERRS